MKTGGGFRRSAAQRFLLAVAVWVTQGGAASAWDVPPTQGFVTDLGDKLTAEEKTALETQLRGYAAGKPSVEIAVLIVPQLEGETISSYARRVYYTWKVGRTRNQRGILFLVGLQERKIGLWTGGGVQPILTLEVCNSLIREVIAPPLKAGRFAEGIKAGCEAMVKLLTESAQEPK